MPVESVDAARAWRERNVRPRMPAWSRAPEPSSAALVRVDELHRLAQRALLHGMFAEVAPALRQALRAVPVERREEVQLDVAVWDALLWKWSDLGPDAANAGSPAQAMSDDDAARWGRFWYALAAEDQRVESPFGPTAGHQEA